MSCMGEMTEQAVFAFGFLRANEKWDSGWPNVVRYHLVASAKDLLSTWGPGKLVTAAIDLQQVFAACIGDGYVARIEEGDETIYHWTHGQLPIVAFSTSFRRRSKMRIGARVVENPGCKANIRDQLNNAMAYLEELGTFPTYWQVSERQGGFQAGQYVTLQINETWVRMPGRTKKAQMLSQQAIYITDLDSPFGVQVSICTGIAKRVLLREVLADLLLIYIASLVTTPPLWALLNTDHRILEALRLLNLKGWLVKLDHQHQQTLEKLVLAILFLLQDTGIDIEGETFVIGCIQPGLPFQCFKVPCKQENSWSWMLADSDEITTFAYVTTRCLQTSHVKCRGPALVDFCVLQWHATRNKVLRCQPHQEARGSGT